MTPTRAEEIATKLQSHLLGQGGIVSGPEFIASVSEAITLAVEEAVKADCRKCQRAISTWCETCAVSESNANYRMAIAQEREACAKIADNHLGTIGLHRCYCSCDIASAIRSRK